MLVDHGLPSSSFMRVMTSSRLPTCSQIDDRCRPTVIDAKLCYAGTVGVYRRTYRIT